MSCSPSLAIITWTTKRNICSCHLLAIDIFLIQHGYLVCTQCMLYDVSVDCVDLPHTYWKYTSATINGKSLGSIVTKLLRLGATGKEASQDAKNPSNSK